MKKAYGVFFAMLAALYGAVASYLWTIDAITGTKTLRLGAALFTLGCIGAGIAAYFLLR